MKVRRLLLVCALTVFTVLPVAQASANAVSGLPDFTQLIEANSPAVVKISTVTRTNSVARQGSPYGNQIPEIFRHLLEPRQMPRKDMRSMGSGFFISADGYLLTNNHVIEGADQISIRMTDRREFDAVIIGSDPRSDLALLKVEQKGLPFLKLADSESMKIGEWVVAIGSPFGLEFSASAGIVSAMGRSIPTEQNENYVPFIQTDVAINPGNSGGPLFNLRGEVVGVNSQIYTRSGGSIGLSFAIPSNTVKNVVAQLRDKGRVDRGWLGVVIQEVDRNLAQSFGLDKPIGALIAQLEPGGPAEKGGIQVGDVVIEFNGSPIETMGDLPHAVGSTIPGEKVNVVVVRQGNKRKLKVTVDTLGGAGVISASSSSIGGRLGVLVEKVDDRTISSWRLAGGVVVRDVAPDSPAAKSGVSPGDVIVQIGYEDVLDEGEFHKIVEALPADTLVPIRFFREGRPTFRTIMLER